MNEKVDWGKQFGVRCNRFAYLIEDGQIVKKFDDFIYRRSDEGTMMILTWQNMLT